MRIEKCSIYDVEKCFQVPFDTGKLSAVKYLCNTEPIYYRKTWLRLLQLEQRI